MQFGNKKPMISSQKYRVASFTAKNSLWYKLRRTKVTLTRFWNKKYRERGREVERRNAGGFFCLPDPFSHLRDDGTIGTTRPACIARFRKRKKLRRVSIFFSQSLIGSEVGQTPT